MNDATDQQVIDMGAPHQWPIDRRIPVATIITWFAFVVVQTAALAWWGSGITLRQNITDQRVEKLETQLGVLSSQAVAIAHLEEKVNTIKDGIADIKTGISGINQTRAR